MGSRYMKGKIGCISSVTHNAKRATKHDEYSHAMRRSTKIRRRFSYIL